MRATGKTIKRGKKGISTLIDIAQKGNDLWDEYGQTIKEIASSINKNDAAEEGEQSLSPLSEEEQSLPALNEEEQGEEAERDTFFEEQQSRLYNTIVKDTILAGQLTNPQQCMAALSEIYSVADETIKYCAEQETKRETIRAERDVAIAKIKEMGELVRVYLEKTYDERRDIFAKQFEVIDASIASGNVEMLAMTLNSMNELAASSPFKNLADIQSVKQGLIDNTEWDI